MPCKFDASANIREGLKQDILWLLIANYSYKERAQLERLNQWSWKRLGTELVLLESVVRDIVSRITALDDSTKNNRSFQTLFTAMKREGLDSARSKKIDIKVKVYRRSVNELKVSHRNHYISHVGTNASVQPRVVDEPVAFIDATSKAVNLLDYIEEMTIPYYFQLGSDQKIDLRMELANTIS